MITKKAPEEIMRMDLQHVSSDGWYKGTIPNTTWFPSLDTTSRNLSSIGINSLGRDEAILEPSTLRQIHHEFSYRRDAVIALQHLSSMSSVGSDASFLESSDFKHNFHDFCSLSESDRKTAVTAPTVAMALLNRSNQVNSFADASSVTEVQNGFRLLSVDHHTADTTDTAIAPLVFGLTRGENSNQTNKVSQVGIEKFDVLLGRGGLTNNHEGNQRFRKKIADFKQWYGLCKSTKKKAGSG